MHRGSKKKSDVLFVLALIVVGFISPLEGSAQTPLADRAHEVVVEWFEDAPIPGLGFVLVHTDSVISARGFGVKNPSTAEPVDGTTRFAIASFTKSVTSTALAVLVDEGALDWDDPAMSHLPDLAFSDPWVTEHATVRDLLAMRVSLPDADRMALSASTPREVVLRADESPIDHFRASFGLAPNFSYTVAGEIVSAAAGQPWEAFVRERLFEPLGMSRTTPAIDEVKGQSDLAVPHVMQDDDLVRVELTDYSQILGAGSLFSTPQDVGQWLRLHLGAGRFGNQQIVSTEALGETHRAQQLNRGQYQGVFNPHAVVSAYAFGWVVSEYRNSHVLEHGGAARGYNASMAFLPEQDVGFALLANLDTSAAWEPLQRLKFALLDLIISHSESSGDEGP